MSKGSATSENALANAVTYRVLRELGRRSRRAYIAVREGNLVVLHRFTRDPKGLGDLVSAEEMAILLRDARCVETNWHPNIAKVRHVDLEGETLSIATELVDGITLDELITAAGDRLADGVLARITLDVLAGLSALHGLRDGIHAPLSAFHGELCPANIVVGKDGVARLVAVFRPRPVRITDASEALAYAPPETLAGEVDQDARVDVYAVGVILWEAMMGRPLYEDTTAARLAQRQREEDVPRPDGPLAEVAMRALAFDPGLRFKSAQEMATAIRAVAGSVAQGSVVAQLVTELAADRIRARRAEFEPFSTGRHRAVTFSEEARSGTHVRAPSPVLEPRTVQAWGSGGLPPDAPTPAAPAVFAAVAASMPRETGPRPPMPASVFGEHDWPGPRESVSEFAAISEELTSADFIEDEDDGEALAAAREVVVSSRSVAPPPERDASSSMPSLEAPPLPAPPSTYRAAPSTPPAIQGLPRRLATSAANLIDDDRRIVPLIVGIAAAALVVLIVGAALIARRNATESTPTHAIEEPTPPSTVVVPPPSSETIPPPTTEVVAPALPTATATAPASASSAPEPPTTKSVGEQPAEE